MFLLLAEETYRHSDTIRVYVVGEFASDEEANAAIIAKVNTFNERDDGGGTEFLRVDSGDYVKIEGQFFVRPDQVLAREFPMPDDVRLALEPY